MSKNKEKAPIVDTIFHWKGNGDGWGKWDSHCRLRIYKPRNLEQPQLTVVVVTEQPDNSGTSITNCVEHLATKVLNEFNILPKSLIWIEHYASSSYDSKNLKEEFALVTFTWKGDKAYSPQWKCISRTFVQELTQSEVL